MNQLRPREVYGGEYVDCVASHNTKDKQDGINHVILVMYPIIYKIP